MLHLTNNQLDKLVVPNEQALVDFIANALRQDSADYVEGLPIPTLQRMVRTGIARARSYGLTAPEDLLTYVGIMFQVAPNFDRQPAIHAVLVDPVIPPNKKLDVLTEPRFDAAWDEADAAYDPDAWSPKD
jgi:hypothetical protein